MAPSLLEPLALRLSRWLEQARAEGDGSLCWDDANNAMLLRTGLAVVVGMERGARQHSVLCAFMRSSSIVTTMVKGSSSLL